MASLRAALLSLPLVVTTSAGAQSPPAAPAAEPAGARSAGTPVPPASAPAASASPAGVPAREQGRSRIGLGVGIGTNGVMPTLYVPIDTGAVRWEGEFAYAKASADDANASATHLGVGLFGLAPTSPSVQAYGGVRIQYARLESGASSNAVRVAAALGGEWAPVPAVALGVEGQLGYTGASASGSSASGIDTSAQAFLRIFLKSFGGPASAKPAAATPASTRLQKCGTSDDCDRGICYDGYCRR